MKQPKCEDAAILKTTTKTSQSLENLLRNKQNTEDAPSIEFKIKIHVLSITNMNIFLKSSLWWKRKTYIFQSIVNSYIFIIIIKKNCTITLKPSNWDKDDLYNYYTYIKKYMYYCKNCKRQCKNMKCHPLRCKYLHIVLLF